MAIDYYLMVRSSSGAGRSYSMTPPIDDRSLFERPTRGSYAATQERVDDQGKQL
jgi:hypothetical protein